MPRSDCPRSPGAMGGKGAQAPTGVEEAIHTDLCGRPQRLAVEDRIPMVVPVAVLSRLTLQASLQWDPLLRLI